MKKTLLILLCTAIFTGCKKDENDKLIGKWTLKRVVVTAVVNGKADIVKDSLTTNNNFYLQLNSNKTGSSNIYESYYTYYKSIKGNFFYTYSNSRLDLTYNIYTNHYAIGTINKDVTWIDDNNIMLRYRSTDPFIAGMLEGNPGLLEGSKNSYISVDQYYSK